MNIDPSASSAPLRPMQSSSGPRPEKATSTSEAPQQEVLDRVRSYAKSLAAQDDVRPEAVERGQAIHSSDKSLGSTPSNEALARFLRGMMDVSEDE